MGEILNDTKTVVFYPKHYLSIRKEKMTELAIVIYKKINDGVDDFFLFFL